MRMSTVDEVIESEIERVERWRVEELIRAGYDPLAAGQIALRPDIDLHQAIGLLAHGCPVELAVRILLKPARGRLTGGRLVFALSRAPHHTGALALADIWLTKPDRGLGRCTETAQTASVAECGSTTRCWSRPDRCTKTLLMVYLMPLI
jgi:hypothetical protein